MWGPHGSARARMLNERVFPDACLSARWPACCLRGHICGRDLQFSSGIKAFFSGKCGVIYHQRTRRCLRETPQNHKQQLKLREPSEVGAVGTTVRIQGEMVVFFLNVLYILRDERFCLFRVAEHTNW